MVAKARRYTIDTGWRASPRGSERVRTLSDGSELVGSVVERDDGYWAWEVRHGMAVVAKGTTSQRREACEAVEHELTNYPPETLPK